MSIAQREEDCNSETPSLEEQHAGGFASSALPDDPAIEMEMAAAMRWDAPPTPDEEAAMEREYFARYGSAEEPARMNDAQIVAGYDRLAEALRGMRVARRPLRISFDTTGDGGGRAA